MIADEFSMLDKPRWTLAEANYCLRQASSSDAEAISALYVRIYTPIEGGDARNYYPFPQIMNPANVASMIRGGDTAWLVAEERDGALIGSAAAMRNIGDTADRIAEVFGVAVEPAYRRHGLGSALVGALLDELAASEFILCEARTDEAGGWKVARNAGFLPVGYEPYAHSMPVGFESMVLTGRWPRSSRHDGEIPRTAPVRRLREAVMGLTSAPHDPLGASDRERRPEVLPLDIRLNVCRDDEAGSRWFDRPAHTFDRGAGIVGLNPLHGVDDRSGRFMNAYYLALSESSELGAARVAYDRVDARARILGLRTAIPGIRPALLQYAVNDLLKLARDGRLVIVTLAAGGCFQTQETLTDLGFFPTAYLPAFIATWSGRSDVVQYTLLAGCSLRESAKTVSAKDWPEAEKVIGQVLSLREQPKGKGCVFDPNRAFWGRHTRASRSGE